MSKTLKVEYEDNFSLNYVDNLLTVIITIKLI